MTVCANTPEFSLDKANKLLLSNAEFIIVELRMNISKLFGKNEQFQERSDPLYLLC